MTMTINQQSLAELNVSNRFTYRLERNRALSIDRLNLEVQGINEFKVNHPHSILHANDRLSATVYKDNGYSLMDGYVLLSGYDFIRGTSQIEIVPDLLEILNRKISFSHSISEGNTPLDVLWSLFNQLDATSYLSTNSFFRLNNAMKAAEIKGGLSINLDTHGVSLFDVLNDFAKAYVVDIYSYENKLHFISPLFQTSKGVMIKDSMVMDYHESFSENEIVNFYTIQSANYTSNSISLNSVLGLQSIAHYGIRAVDIAASLWQVQLNNKHQSTWLKWVIDSGNARITADEFPRKLLTLRVLPAVSEELSLNDRFQFQEYSYEIINLSQDEDRATITGVRR